MNFVGIYILFLVRPGPFPKFYRDTDLTQPKRFNIRLGCVVKDHGIASVVRTSLRLPGINEAPLDCNLFSDCKTAALMGMWTRNTPAIGGPF